MGKTVELHPTMAQALKPFLMFLDSEEVSNDDDAESD